MKIRITILILAFFVSTTVIAQRKQVVGYINADKILNEMPEVKEAEKKLVKIKTDYEAYLQNKEKEYNDMLTELKSQIDSMPQLIKENKIKRLEGMYAELQNFQLDAQKDILAQEKALFDPHRSKLRKTIDDVAKELGYTMVIDNSKGLVLFTDGKDDIESAVRKKLGL